MKLGPRYVFHATGTGNSGYFKVPGFSHDMRGLIHAFSTRPDPANDHGPEDIEETFGIRPIFRGIPPIFLTNILMSIGGEKCTIRTVRQVHGDAILYLWRGEVRDESPVEGDGLVTNQAGFLLGIRTADCLPILLVDPEAGCVGAIHAGWRGTVKQVARRAVECMVRQGGAEPSRIRAALGPSVGPCCYPVGPEVIEGIRESLPGRWKEALVEGERLDLKAANRAMLEEAGLAPDGIFGIDLCTSCNRELFHSYRRDGKRAGRQIALIGLRPA